MKDLSIKRLFLLAALAFIKIYLISEAQASSGSSGGTESYFIRNWTAENGLPHNTITALLQTSDGFIWIGTPTGLVRFDGINFKTLTRWNTQVLKNDYILSLYEDNNKTLWAGTDGGGVCRLQDGQWKRLTREDGLSNDHIRTICGDWQGNIWIGTDYGLNRLNKHGIKVYTKRDGLYDNIITSLAMDSWNNLWVGTLQGGLAKLHEQNITVYDYQFRLNNLSIFAVYADQRGMIWVGTMQGLYYIKEGKGIAHYVKNTGFTPITSFVEQSPGLVWIGTMADGIKKMVRSTLSSGIEGISLPDDHIRCLLKDSDGNIWIGSDTEGLIQMKKRTINNITTTDGMTESKVSTVLEDRSGDIWIGTENQGLCRFQRQHLVQKLNINDGLVSNKITALYKSKSGQLWIGTRDRGINIYERNKSVKHIGSGDGLSSGAVTSILEDNYNRIWIGTANGLNIFKSGQLGTFERNGEFPNAYVNTLIRSRGDTIIVGTKSGIYKIIKNVILPLSSDSLEQRIDCLALYQDNDKNLWIGTNGNGLIRWRKGTFSSINRIHGLHDNYVLGITEDDYGNLWMGSYTGIFHIKKSDLVRYFDKEVSFIHSTYYNEAEGMVSRQCSGGFQSLVNGAISGKLYFATVEGLVICDPEKRPQHQNGPNIIIDKVWSGNDTLQAESDGIFYLQNDMISIGFTAIDFVAPEKIRFKYRLKGLNKDYTYLDPSKVRQVYYHDLSQGSYQFQLWATNNEGVWNEQIAEIPFKIYPVFYLNPVFFIFLLVTGLIISSVLVYMRHQVNVQKQLERYKTSTLSPNLARTTIAKLENLMSEEKLFLDPDLNLTDLSNRLNIHYNHLSRIINEHFRMSYNDFVNKRRIEEMKKRFTDPVYIDKTILEIMYETGFYSKSVFNTAFKKFTGLTPSEYRNKILNDRNKAKID